MKRFSSSLSLVRSMCTGTPTTPDMAEEHGVEVQLFKVARYGCSCLAQSFISEPDLGSPTLAVM
jgi:hypothetical protein